MTATVEPTIAICIATYKRPCLLSNNIKAISKLNFPKKHNLLVIVVDNDIAETARAIVENLVLPNEHKLFYFVEPTRGLSAVRNRLLDEAIRNKADYIGFIDDDEFPHPSWLSAHLATLHKYEVDIVTGPVVPTYETSPTNNIKADIKHPTGYVPRHIATGNVFFKNTLLTEGKLRFNSYYNFIGGEDFDFFDQAIAKGFTKIVCAEAIVYETITEERRTKKYLFYRHFTGAINNVLYYKSKKNKLLAWWHFTIKAIGKIPAFLFHLIIFIFTFNNKRLEAAIVKLASSLGYFAGLLNIIVQRYR